MIICLLKEHKVNCCNSVNNIRDAVTKLHYIKMINLLVLTKAIGFSKHILLIASADKCQMQRTLNWLRPVDVLELHLVSMFST